MNTTKKLISIGIGAMLLTGAANQALAYESHVGYSIGYRYIELDYEYRHDTHPDDSFLTNSDVPGSAGTTGFSEAHMFYLGGRYAVDLSKSFSVHVDGGFLLGGDTDRRKNANDTRSDETSAYVYSSFGHGGQASVGLDYRITHKLSCGVEGQWTAVAVESGWDRWGAYDDVVDEYTTFASIGLKAGYHFNEFAALEAGYQFGEHPQAALSVTFSF